jgi:hypothetical protein
VKSKLKKFTTFSDRLFPSEVAFVAANNDFQDPEYFELLERMGQRVNGAREHVEFDPETDPRKYSRLMQAMERKLESIDVDAYYAWISRINYLINTDDIPTEEQARILRETDAYSPGWFHAGSFYRAVATYEAYLLIRYRERDLQVIQDFLAKYASSHEENERILNEVKVITERIVKMDNGKDDSLNTDDLERLLSYFSNPRLSKKCRYHAWLAYHMHHLNTRQFEPMVEPLQALESQIFEGDFYSRRILANFYANKLLLLSHLGKYEEAAYCGAQSIKHQTEDYLYYINNYCSVLMHLGRYDEAAAHMKSNLVLYRETRDKSRKLIFASNYCRCLNALSQHRQSIRLAAKELEELKQQVFKFRWHYFFRVYLGALQANGQNELLLRLARKYKLTDREQKAGKPPYLRILVLTAEYQELRISDKAYHDTIATLRSQTDFKKYPDLQSFFQQAESVQA